MGLANEVYDYETGRKSICVTRSHGHSTFTNEYHGNQLGLAIITPPPGRGVCVNGVSWATAANAGAAALDFPVSGIIVWRGYTNRQYAGGEVGLHIEGAINEALTFTSNVGASSFFLAVNYRITD
jgi:hypothetical protein